MESSSSEDYRDYHKNKRKHSKDRRTTSHQRRRKDMRKYRDEDEYEYFSNEERRDTYVYESSRNLKKDDWDTRSHRSSREEELDRQFASQIQGKRHRSHPKYSKRDNYEDYEVHEERYRKKSRRNTRDHWSSDDDLSYEERIPSPKMSFSRNRHHPRGYLTQSTKKTQYSLDTKQSFVEKSSRSQSQDSWRSRSFSNDHRHTHKKRKQAGKNYQSSGQCLSRKTEQYHSQRKNIGGKHAKTASGAKEGKGSSDSLKNPTNILEAEPSGMGREQQLREAVLRQFLLKQRQQQDHEDEVGDSDADEGKQEKNTPAKGGQDSGVDSMTSIAARGLFSREHDASSAPLSEDSQSSNGDETIVFRVFEDENDQKENEQGKQTDTSLQEDSGFESFSEEETIEFRVFEENESNARTEEVPPKANLDIFTEDRPMYRASNSNEIEQPRKPPLHPTARSKPASPSLSASPCLKVKGKVGPEKKDKTASNPPTKVFDMFSDDIAELPKPQEMVADRGEDEQLRDNWDDEEGYYAFQTGELVGNGRYKVIHALGRGVFSTVLKATDTKSPQGQQVALKVIRSNDLMLHAGQKELGVLRQLMRTDPAGKRHCVALLDSFEYRGHLFIVMEAMHANLRKLVKRHGGGQGISLKAVRSFAKQLFISLKHIHKNGFVHADLKPDNMVVNSDLNILKVCDFGSAYKIHEMEDLNKTQYICSRFYRAPEIALGYPPKGPPMDIWSAGCSLYEMYTGKVLFTGKTNNQIVKNIMELCGKIPKKLVKQAHFQELYFDEELNYLSVTKVQSESGENYVTKVLTNYGQSKHLWNLLLPPKAAKKTKSSLRFHIGLFQDLLEKCFELDPIRRITAAQALKHSFIKRDVQGAEG